jgi:hypothetical protein
MKTKLTVFVVVLGSTLAAIAVSPSTAAENVTESATGSGELEFTSEAGVTALRTFSFEATEASDGTVAGYAQIDNRAEPGRLRIRIDCLNVIGNIAVLSGTIVSSTESGVSVGDSSIFGVQDNGEGAAAPSDRITQQFANSGLVCTDINTANVAFYTDLLRTVEHGNVQIH